MTGLPTYFRAEADFRRWLEGNHTTAPELLVGFWKKGSGKASIDWPQARAMHGSPDRGREGLTSGELLEHRNPRRASNG